VYRGPEPEPRRILQLIPPAVPLWLVSACHEDGDRIVAYFDPVIALALVEINDGGDPYREISPIWLEGNDLLDAANDRDPVWFAIVTALPTTPEEHAEWNERARKYEQDRDARCRARWEKEKAKQAATAAKKVSEPTP
jgi:hypothetical protein